MSSPTTRSLSLCSSLSVSPVVHTAHADLTPPTPAPGVTPFSSPYALGTFKGCALPSASGSASVSSSSSPSPTFSPCIPLPPNRTQRRRQGSGGARNDFEDEDEDKSLLPALQVKIESRRRTVSSQRSGSHLQTPDADDNTLPDLLSPPCRMLSDELLSPATSKAALNVPSMFEVATGACLADVASFVADNHQSEVIWEHFLGKNKPCADPLILARMIRVIAFLVREKHEKQGKARPQGDKKSSREQVVRVVKHLEERFNWQRKLYVTREQFLFTLPRELRTVEREMRLEDAPGFQQLVVHGMTTVREEAFED